jgi:hypothetical protein
MLKRILCHKSTIDGDALVGICENDELQLSVVAC